MNERLPHRCDVLIVGAGVAGGALALALGGAGLSVIVLEQARPADIVSEGFDGRTTAFSLASRRVLTGIGLWPRIAADAEPILDIRITDGAAPVVLGFGHAEIGEEPMGHIVENRLVRAALFAALEAAPNVTLLAPARLASHERSLAGVAARLADGTEIRASLMVGADGRNSAIRRAAGIRVAEWRYRQTALVCAIAHEKPHRGVAHERFMPAGPFAVLPMTDDDTGRHRSSIVWTEHPRTAAVLHAASAERYDAELQERVGDFVGRVHALPGRWTYPLGVVHADRYVATRLALVGDAAHGIHPIAGQGLNLGIRDVAALAEVLVEGARLGLDPGDAALLRDYERWRRPDNMQMILATDGLNRLFGTRFGPVQLVRDAGLAAVQRLGPVRRFFIRRAMGLAADAPRLMRGEPL